MKLLWNRQLQTRCGPREIHGWQGEESVLGLRGCLSGIDLEVGKMLISASATKIVIGKYLIFSCLYFILRLPQFIAKQRIRHTLMILFFGEKNFTQIAANDDPDVLHFKIFRKDPV